VHQPDHATSGGVLASSKSHRRIDDYPLLRMELPSEPGRRYHQLPHSMRGYRGAPLGVIDLGCVGDCYVGARISEHHRGSYVGYLRAGRKVRDDRRPIFMYALRPSVEQCRDYAFTVGFRRDPQ
jgi:hypothetical protein